MRKRIFGIVTTVGIFCSVMAGCGTAAISIGEKTDDAKAIVLTNQTGQTISKVSVKNSLETDYPDNMLQAEEGFAADQTATLYYEPATEEDEETAKSTSRTADMMTFGDEAAESAVEAVGVTYSVQLTMEDESTYELHDFPLETVEEADIHLEEGVAYLTYTDEAGEEGSTLEAEKSLKATADAKAVAEPVIEAIYAIGQVSLDNAAVVTNARAAYDALTEEQKAQVTNLDVLVTAESALATLQSEAAAATSASTYTDSTYYDNSYSSGSTYYDSSSYQDTSGSSAGSDDGCVGDGLTF